MTQINSLISIILWIFMFMILFLIMNKFIHPIIIMMLMIIFTLSLCINMSMWKLNSIYPIMIFIIMISGLMIIFMYFSSLISNEQLSINMKFKMLILITLNILIIFIHLFSYFNLNQFFFSLFDSNPLNFLFLNKFINILDMYSNPSNNMTILTILFILLSFITIIKINSSSIALSLRKIYKYESN